MDSEEKHEGGIQDSHTCKYQYLKIIWIERLILKVFINLIPPTPHLIFLVASV